MALCQLSVRDFRNLAAVELEPLVDGFNFLFGANGSGKTSLLEAIYYLGHRRSFRSLQTERLVRYHSEQFSLFSKVKDENNQQLIPLGVERMQDGDFRVRVAGEDLATIFELAAYLPMRLINVHSHHLLEGSPLFRRKYLDWGVFYQNKEFHSIWLRYNRLLKQRNAALRRRSVAELNSWSEQLVAAAQSFHRLRTAYLDQLLPLLQSLLDADIKGLFDVSGLSIDYQAGWDLSQPYAEILQNSLPRDLERGHTHSGPHRADLSVKINGIPAKDVLSTGQQKLLVCGMILAQGALLAKFVNKRPIYLIDDLPAELDQHSRAWLIQTLAEQQAQIFVTAVDEEAMGAILAQTGRPVKMFHVKHGEIREVEPCST